MSKDSVRYGRMPRRSRSQDVPTSTTANPQPDQLALYDLILTVSQAHHAFCPFTEEKVKSVKKIPFSLVSENFYIYQ